MAGYQGVITTSQEVMTMTMTPSYDGEVEVRRKRAHETKRSQDLAKTALRG
jgi:hypothetical protein